jgi:hypothetical protein
MKHLALLTLLATFLMGAAAGAAEPEPGMQPGPLATVHLLATGRTGGSSPDGMQFLFLVRRAPGVTGSFSLKETRDFTVAGVSYQEKTQAELGQRFVPLTNFQGSAESFFAKQPGLRGLGPEDLTDAYILTIAIGGARLAAGAEVEIKLEVGFGKAVEPFSFKAPVPPAPSPPSPPAPAPAPLQL